MKTTGKIHNVRLGFATNSSSSHSVLILPKGAERPPEEFDSNQFGWDNFTLTSVDAKREYLRVQSRYSATTPPADGDDGYVDHQSQWGVSLTNFITKELMTVEESRRILEAFVARDEVVILGGNDNSEGHPLLQEHSSNAVHSDWNFNVIKDPKGHLVLFHEASGNKIRVTLDGNTEAPEKGTWPELIDIKITDYCPYACSYCYQGSTTEGYHADFEFLEALVAKMKGTGVLEVALGGGEPTLHPRFADIVELFKAAGIVVNVTSRNIGYWEKVALANDIHERSWNAKNRSRSKPEPKGIPTSAVAFSVDNEVEVTNILSRITRRKKTKKEQAQDKKSDSYNKDDDSVYMHSGFQVHFQVVVGTVSDDMIGKIIDAADGHRVTLLGYKTSGRGAAAMGSLPIMDAPEQLGWIPIWRDRLVTARKNNAASEAYETLFYSSGNYNVPHDERRAQWEKTHGPAPKHMREPNVAIDTTLAALCDEQLRQEGVPPMTYHVNEGAFSCYIDAVEQQIGPNSYMPSEMIQTDTEVIWEAWSRIEAVNVAMPPQ